MDKKYFYGKVSLTGRVSFSVVSEDKESATNIVFEDIEGLTLNLKDGSTLKIDEIEWDLLNECRRGNVSQPNIDDFEIYED